MNTEGTHLCPRCGIRTRNSGRGGAKALCGDCRWSDANTSYVWAAAKAELRRMLASPCACGRGKWSTCQSCQMASAQRLRPRRRAAA